MSFLANVFVHPTQRRVRTIWRLLLQLIAMAIGIIGLLVMMELVLIAVSPRMTEPPRMLIGGILQGVAVVGSVFLAALVLDRRRLTSFGWNSRWPSELGLGLALGVIAMLVIFGIEWSLGWIVIDRVGFDATLSMKRLLTSQACWLGLMILVGVYEEIFSRGYHLKNLSEGFRAWGAWPAIVIATLVSSLLFGALHIQNPNATIVSTLSVVLAGVTLAAGRIATGSLAAPIGLHITWNWMQGPVLGFPVSGNATPGSLVALQQGGPTAWTGGAFGPEAGWLGISATATLLIFFVVLGIRRSDSKRRLARLVLYRRRKMSA